MRKKIYFGSLSGLLQVLVNIVLTIFMISVFVEKLGIETYGLFTLLSVVGNFNLLLNLGFNTSLIKFLIEQGKTEESNKDLVTIFIVLASILFIVVSVLLLNEKFVLNNIFGIADSKTSQDVIFLFRTLILSSVVLFLGIIPNAVFDSLQKTYLSNLLQMMYHVLQKSAVIFVLYTNPNLNRIGSFILSTSVIWIIIIYYFGFKEWGNLKITNYLSEFTRIIKKHFIYSSKIYASNVLGFFYEPITKILIGRFIGLNEVAFFEIALRIKGLFWGIVERILYPITPLIGKLTDKIQIKKIIETVELKLLYFGLIFLSIAVVNMEFLVSLFVKNNIEVVVITSVLILAIYIAVSLPFIPSYQFLVMKGYPEKAFILQFINSVTNTILFFVLVPIYSFWGAISSYLIALVVSSILLVKFRKELLNLKIIENKMALLNLVAVSIIFLCANILLKSFELSIVIHLTLTVVLNTIIILFVNRYWQIISEDDLELFFGKTSYNKNKLLNLLLSKKV